MEPNQLLKGKYTFRCQEQKLVVVKKSIESYRHVVMKALLWALYLPEYPDVQVEVAIGCKYKPDLVATGPRGPRFWAEAGRVGTRKMQSMLKRFNHTHFALAIWGGPLDHLVARVQQAVKDCRRQAPVDVIRFGDHADTRFIDVAGQIRVAHEQLDWCRLS